MKSSVKVILFYVLGGAIFSTSNTKPYSNVRLFLWSLSVLIGWIFDALSVKNEAPLMDNYYYKLVNLC